MTREPFRRCAGCGRRAPQRELRRFAAVAGELVPGREVPGRGVYTCRRAACYERARAQGSFARVLRRSVHVNPALVRLYTGAGSGAGGAGDARPEEQRAGRVAGGDGDAQPEEQRETDG